MSTIKTPPYKQFLTPALHRRFTGAAVVILAICYVEAILIGEKTSCKFPLLLAIWKADVGTVFWLWFPIGTAGIKTLLLFTSALSVFVLRVAQLHLGKKSQRSLRISCIDLRTGARTTPSPSATFTQYFFRLDTIQTIGWYLFSAWFFTEVYVWSAAPSADLSWIAQGKSWERRKLNERPIYLRSVYTIYAVVQSFLHLYYDYDQVSLSTEAPAPSEPATEEPLGLIAGIKAQVFAQARPLQPLFWYDANDIYTSISRNIVLRAACVSILSPFIYAIFIRRRVWSWSLSFAKLVWDVPPTPLSFIPPHYPSLIYRSLSSGFFLLLLWEASNALFTVYVAKTPLKKGQPLTAESKDPNGSLLTGLKSRKEMPKVNRSHAVLSLCALTNARPLPSGNSFTSLPILRLAVLHSSRTSTALPGPSGPRSSTSAYPKSLPSTPVSPLQRSSKHHQQRSTASLA